MVSRGEVEGIVLRIILGIVRFQGGKSVWVRKSRETSESRDRILGGRLRVRAMALMMERSWWCFVLLKNGVADVYLLLGSTW